jgi:hypothetical protein
VPSSFVLSSSFCSSSVIEDSSSSLATITSAVWIPTKDSFSNMTTS